MNEALFADRIGPSTIGVTPLERMLRATRVTFAAGVIALVVVAPAAMAQVGALQKSAEPSPATPASGVAPAPPRDDLPRSVDAIRADLAAARDELDAIEHSSGKALGAPPGTPASEIAERLTLARQLATLLQQQLDSLDRMDAARAQRVDAERAAREWPGFTTPPPYSVLAIDTIRDSLESANARIASAATRQGLFDRFIGTLGDRAKASQGAARLAAEAADRARGSPAHAALEWKRQLVALHARVDVATQDLLRMGSRAAREEAAAAEARRELAQRQLAAADNQVVLSDEDLARVKKDLEARQRTVESEIDRASRAAAVANDARAAAERALAAAQAAPPLPTDDPSARAANLEQLARALEVRREEAITATQRLDLFKGYLVALDGERTVWQGRAETLKSADRLRGREAWEKLSTGIATIRAWSQYINQQLIDARARVTEQDGRVRSADTAAEAAVAQQLLDTFRQRESFLRRAIEASQPLERLIERFRADFEERREASLLERARDDVAGAWFLARQAWNFELFTVSDSYETADGRKIEVDRSVTIGKTAGAVLVVVLGYWLCSFVARRVERLVVRRGHVPPQSAALLRSWILFLLAAILVVFALLLASIPLTAFAFLGGALAIAAGFGLQTLLKNFVAGLMLLFERPMRLGDYVEVDAFRGRVSAIGIRASTITSADGIETMLPNSTFIEGKLTNWTYSTPQARQTLAIGVAYGTPLRKAAEVLQEVLTRHGLVLKDPAPQVYLDDYGDSAIRFVLTYWVDMAPTNDIRRIKSDLLHMIDRAFVDAGIAMPFPQRDVHLDAKVPLEVRVVGATPQAPASD